MDVIHIVGCGTIGSNLVLSICKQHIISKLHIYDPDVVTYSERQEFPFQDAVMGMPKVDALSLLISGLDINKNTQLFCHESEVIKPIKDDGFIIDCRDKKDIGINADMRLSMDGPVLIIDCRKGIIPVYDYSDYVLRKDMLYIELGISIILNNIFRGMYNDNDYKVYDLRSLLHSSKTVNMDV